MIETRKAKRRAEHGRHPLEPTRARKRHGPVELGEVLADENGLTAQPYRAIDLLTIMERRGTITKKMHLAGKQFREDFRLAGHDALQANDPSRIRAAGKWTGGQAGNAAAREKAWHALRALGGIGSPCGAIVWHVVGCEVSLKAWAVREGWNGRTMDVRVAVGLLKGALGVLEAHYEHSAS